MLTAAKDDFVDQEYREKPRNMVRKPWTPVPATVVLLLLVAVTGCAGTGAAGTPGGALALGAGPPGSDIPPGVVLRVADQSRSVEYPLLLAGQLQDAPYRIEFASFASGPLVNEGLASDKVDVGTMGDVPALFARAGGLDVVTVATTRTSGPGMTLMARDGSGIRTLDDLQGRKVAFTTGTAQSGFALRALKRVGLTKNDVEHVDVPLQDLPSVLESAQADVSVISEEARVKYLQAHPGGVQLLQSRDIEPPAFGYFLASRTALAEPGKAAAIQDFVRRRIRAEQWKQANKAVWEQEYYVKERKQSPENARLVNEGTGTTTFVPIGDSQKGAARELAQVLNDGGLLKTKVDTEALYEPAVSERFNQLVEEAYR
jgi:sulfonate transport system substrate-binding protein